MRKLLLGIMTVFLTSTSYSQSQYVGFSRTDDSICGYTSSEVECWGSNYFGQTRSMEGFTNIHQVKTNRQSTCALDDHGLTCWGSFPELTPEMKGPLVTKFDSTPDSICTLSSGRLNCVGKVQGTKPLHLTKVSDFAIASEFSCAIQEGKPYCWGNNSNYYQHFYQSIPQDIGIAVKIKISNSITACVLNTENKIICWGADSGPIPQTQEKIIDLDLGRSFGCFLTEVGNISCWGDHDSSAMIDTEAKFIGLSSKGICAISLQGKIICDKSSNVPPPPPIKNPTHFGANDDGTCFVQQGKIICTDRPEDVTQTKNLTYFSVNHLGFCWIDDKGPSCKSGGVVLKAPENITRITQMVIGNTNEICAVHEEGKVSCWGEPGAIVHAPPVPLTNIRKISHSLGHYIALGFDNSLNYWSDGRSSVRSYLHPTIDPTLKVVDITTGYNTDCYLLAGDIIKCWKSISNTGIVFTLNPPRNLKDIKGIASGFDFACAYTENEVICWGDDSLGATTPPAVKGRIKSLVAGGRHACLEDDEKIKCWGDNRKREYQFIQE